MMPWPLLVMGYVAIVTSPVISYEIIGPPGEEADYGPPDTSWKQSSLGGGGGGGGGGYQQWPPNDQINGIDKRALSVLSRWRPFTSALSGGSFGRVVGPSSGRRFSARSPAMLRPLGQPLRWGRRR